jgi:hypothetical protein
VGCAIALIIFAHASCFVFTFLTISRSFLRLFGKLANKPDIVKVLLRYRTLKREEIKNVAVTAERFAGLINLNPLENI